MLWLVLLQQILHTKHARLHKFTATDLKLSEIDCPSSHIYINGGRIINWTRLEVCCCKLVHALHAISGTLNMENPAEVSCNLCARLCEHRHVWDTDFDIGFKSHKSSKEVNNSKCKVLRRVSRQTSQVSRPAVELLWNLLPATWLWR